MAMASGLYLAGPCFSLRWGRGRALATHRGRSGVALLFQNPHGVPFAAKKKPTCVGRWAVQVLKERTSLGLVRIWRPGFGHVPSW